jgi:hypothetical protein
VTTEIVSGHASIPFQRAGGITQTNQWENGMSKLSKILFRAALVAAIGLVPWRVAAGGIRVESGSLAFLKPGGHVNVEYDYSDMKVGRKPKDAVPEQEFVARQNQKQAGRGDSWRLEWIGRTNQFQLKFQELLNKQFAEGNISLEFGAFKDAKYTLILKTKTILTGSQGFAPSPPCLTADAVFVETNNRTNTVAVVKLVNLPGQGMWEFDLREAYAKAGKDLGILIRGKIK